MAIHEHSIRDSRPAEMSTSIVAALHASWPVDVHDQRGVCVLWKPLVWRLFRGVIKKLSSSPGACRGVSPTVQSSCWQPLYWRFLVRIPLTSVQHSQQLATVWVTIVRFCWHFRYPPCFVPIMLYFTGLATFCVRKMGCWRNNRTPLPHDDPVTLTRLFWHSYSNSYQLVSIRPCRFNEEVQRSFV